MKNHILLTLLTLCLCATVVAEETKSYPRVSFVGPASGKTTIPREQLVILVVEGPYLSYEKNPIPEKGEVEYVNNLLKLKKNFYVGLYSREGVKYGDVLRAIDVLRKTDAKDIGVSMIEVPAGREP